MRIKDITIKEMKAYIRDTSNIKIGSRKKDALYGIYLLIKKRNGE